MTLIVSRPGPLRDSIKALLQSLPCPDRVTVADNGNAVADALASEQPDVVLVLDAAALDPRGTELLQRGRRDGLFARWLFMAENAEQERAALAAGADAVVFSGLPAPRLFAVIGGLLAGDRTGEVEC